MADFVIGARGSLLSRVQTDWVVERLRERHPDLNIVVRTYLTQGDRSQVSNTPLASYSEKGIFVKELESALLAGEIDAAVHSMKDLAAQLPDGLQIASTPAREDVRDVVVGKPLAQLPGAARVGTGSVRRRALLRELRPDLQICEIRGNVDTRVRKLREGQYDAILLAAAGLKRLGRAGEIDEYCDPDAFIPDPGQGALALEARSDDARAARVLRAINDDPTEIATRAERAFLAALGGGCQTPVGAWASIESGTITLRVAVAADEIVHRLVLTGPAAHPERLGLSAASGLSTAL